MKNNDIQPYYIEEGRGEVLILIHGNGEDGNYFINQIPYFSKKYRVITVDTRGHGKTKRGVKTFTIRQFVDDLFLFMKELKIEKANIMGFSDGGNIALLFALKYPEKINKLIINGANLNTKGIKVFAQLPVEIAYKITRFFSKKNVHVKRKMEMLGLMVNDPKIEISDLKKIKAHTLVIAGTKDLIKEKHTKEIYEALPNAKLAFVKGNHFVAKKNPEKFNREVGIFLNMK